MAFIHWVRREEASRELRISLRTLDRWIDADKFKVRRCGRRVYVRLSGPRPLTDQQLLENMGEELADSKASMSALSSEVEQLKESLRIQSRRALSAENRAALYDGRASRAWREKTSLERELDNDRRQRTYLMWALAALDAIGVMLVISAFFIGL